MKTKPKNKNLILTLSVNLLFFMGCASGIVAVKKEAEIQKALPKSFVQKSGSPKIYGDQEEDFNANNIKASKKSSAELKWEYFFTDLNLKNLINEALKNNQELNIITQEIKIAKNEMMARQGEFLPKLGLGAHSGVERVGEYTHQGVTDRTAEYEPGKFIPRDLRHYSFGLNFSWEMDIWSKLRNATKSALYRYLASVDGRNFMTTKLVAEISSSYYELLALDKQLEIVEKNIKIQRDAVKLVELQQKTAKVTSLAVKRFEAEVLKNRSRRYELRQEIVQAENRINFLLGRYPQPVVRTSNDFMAISLIDVYGGIPSSLLEKRPDVKQAQNKLKASNLDVKVARAKFYPSLSIDADVGYEAFNLKHLLKPESLFYSVIGGLTAPLLNRKAIKADYLTSNSKQVQAVFEYEQVMIKAYTEVVNQMSKVNNLEKTYVLKAKQAELLTSSVDISNILFRAARADYVEVLMTRRDALEAQIELVEVKLRQMEAVVSLYKSLGGGWH